MVQQTGLHLISKLQKNSALYYPYDGEQKPLGARKKYGDKIDYENIDKKYLNPGLFIRLTYRNTDFSQ